MRSAVITGANRGLGWAAAKALAELGFFVSLCGRNEGALVARKKELAAGGRKSEVVVLDLDASESIQQGIDRLKEIHPEGIDVLINNAGICREGRHGFDPGIARQTIQVNALGPLELTLGLEEALRRRRGTVVNVSSIMGRLTHMEPGYPGYRMSKAALNCVTRILSEEWKKYGIKVNSVSPGWVRTDMGGPEAERSIEEGVRGILWAALLPEGGPTGGFFRDEQSFEW